MLDLEAQRALNSFRGTMISSYMDTYLARTKEAIALLRQADRESPRELTLYLANLVNSQDREAGPEDGTWADHVDEGPRKLLAEIQPEAYRRMLELRSAPDSGYVAALDVMARCAENRKPEYVVPLLRRSLEVRRRMGLLDSAYAAAATRFASRLRLEGDSLVAAGQAARAEPLLRIPCFKLAARFGRADMVKRFATARRPGFYFAVVEEGEGGAGDAVEVVDRATDRMSVRDLFDVYFSKTPDLDVLRRAVALRGLAEVWRTEIAAILAKAADTRA